MESLGALFNSLLIEESFSKYLSSITETLLAFDRLANKSVLHESTEYDTKDLFAKIRRANQQLNNLQNLLRTSKDSTQKKVCIEDFLDTASDLIKQLSKHLAAARNMNKTGTHIDNLNDFEQFCLRNIAQLKQWMAPYQS